MPERFVPGAEIAALLRLVQGVEDAAVETEPDGEIREIRIAIAPHEPPRRLVRDVESALMSGLGLSVDHRRIRVVAGEGRRDDGHGQNRTGPARILHTQDPDSPRSWTVEERVRLKSVRVDPDGQFYCRVAVEIEADDGRYEAEIREADTPRARLLAAGRATIGALARTFGRETAIALEGVEMFTICDEPAVIARIQARRFMDQRSFHGAALVEGQPHHAAARAVLDALNRYWTAEERVAT